MIWKPSTKLCINLKSISNCVESNLGSLTSGLSWTCCPLSNGMTFTTSLANTRASPEQYDTIRLSLSRTLWTKPTLLFFAPCHPYVGVLTLLLNFTQSPTSNLSTTEKTRIELHFGHKWRTHHNLGKKSCKQNDVIVCCSHCRRQMYSPICKCLHQIFRNPFPR